MSGQVTIAGRWTGALEGLEVTVATHGRAGFAPGPATAVADAVVRYRGGVPDEPHWTRAVQLAP